MASNVAGVDVSEWAERRAAGNITIQKFGQGYLMTIKKFNPNDGSEAEPQFAKVQLKQLEDQKKALQDQITNAEASIVEFNTIINDLEAIE